MTLWTINEQKSDEISSAEHSAMCPEKLSVVADHKMTAEALLMEKYITGTLQ